MLYWKELFVELAPLEINALYSKYKLKARIESNQFRHHHRKYHVFAFQKCIVCFNLSQLESVLIILSFFAIVSQKIHTYESLITPKNGLPHESIQCMTVYVNVRDWNCRSLLPLFFHIQAQVSCLPCPASLRQTYHGSMCPQMLPAPQPQTPGYVSLDVLVAQNSKQCTSFASRRGMIRPRPDELCRNNYFLNMYSISKSVFIASRWGMTGSIQPSLSEQSLLEQALNIV